MAQKPREGDLREKKAKKFHGGACPQIPAEAYIFGTCIGKPSVFILDPCLKTVVFFKPTMEKTLKQPPIHVTLFV